MIWCLSNARSGDLHFGISFVALRALVREIIPNTIHTYPHTHLPTYIHDLTRISIDCLTPASRLRFAFVVITVLQRRRASIRLPRLAVDDFNHIFYPVAHDWMGLMDTEKARSIRIFVIPHPGCNRSDIRRIYKFSCLHVVQWVTLFCAWDNHITFMSPWQSEQFVAIISSRSKVIKKNLWMLLVGLIFLRRFSVELCFYTIAPWAIEPGSCQIISARSEKDDNDHNESTYRSKAWIR